MPVAPTAQIHPTAIVSTDADIGANVHIGPYVVVEGPVAIKHDCRIAPYVHLVGPLVIGQGNQIGTGCVIGSDPQHLAYRGEPTRTEIGDFNVFREHVTIHRGSQVAGHGVTRIGSHNYFMAHSHVAHDCKVGNHCVLVNGALMGGHSEIDDRVFLSGNVGLHQFVRMGRLTLVMGNEGVVKDVPPFFSVRDYARLIGVNTVGMKRAGIATPDITVVRQAFHILCYSDLLQKDAIQKLADSLGGHPLVAEMLQFIRSSKKGIMRKPLRRTEDDED
jgi:UDP-N-acetylglucosamine acyltransferase